MKQDVPGTALFIALNDLLSSLQVEVEFYFLGGAVMFQAFNASPKTAQVNAMFKPVALVSEAIREVARQKGVTDEWPAKSVRAQLAGAESGTYAELSHLCVFVPLPEYVLGVKCAALGLGDEFADTEDVRYVLRAMNVSSPDRALEIVTQYFSARQLVPRMREALVSILGA